MQDGIDDALDLELPIDEAPEPEDPEDQPFTWDEDADNLVATFEAHPDGVKALKKIADKVYTAYEEARDGSEEYRERMAADWKLFAGELPKKSWPWVDCANTHVPIMLENLTRLTARVSAELFDDWSHVFGYYPVGPGAEDEADILTLHGNWQIREQIVDFPRQQDRALTAFFAWGDVTIHSFYDEIRRTNRHETLTPDEFFVPFVFTTTAPDYSDCPYLVKVLHRYRHDLQRMRDRWEHVDDVLKRKAPSWDDEPEELIAKSVAETTLIEPPTSGGAPYKLLQFEGWMELPDQENDRYVQVIMDHTTKTILSLTIHEEIDWRDRARFELQQEEYAAYSEAKGAYEASYDQAAAQEDQLREGLSMSMAMPAEGKAAMIAQAHAPIDAMQPPPRPTWMKSDEDSPPLPIKKVPIHLFSHGVCWENMAGSLGLSFGRIQADFNRAANIMQNQFIDAATLSNARSFLKGDGIQIKGGEDGVEMAPGKFLTVTGATGDDLRKSIFEIGTQPANPQLMDGVKQLYQYGQSSIQSPGILSGESGKSGETYRGVATRLDQAVKQLSVSARKYAMFLTQVLKNNAKLNAMFLDDEEMIRVLNHKTQTMQTIQVGRQMYERNYRVYISADLKFSSEAERKGEADELVQMPQAVPPLQGNFAFQYAAIKKALEARGQFDMVQLLGPPPPPPQMPMGTPPPAPPGPPQGQPGQPQPPEGGPPQ